jgi:hypothetical protein
MARPQTNLRPCLWGGQSWPQPAFQPALRCIHRSRLGGSYPFRPALCPEAQRSRDRQGAVRRDDRAQAESVVREVE